MANIGTFKKSGDSNYTGEIVTAANPIARCRYGASAEQGDDNGRLDIMSAGRPG